MEVKNLLDKLITYGNSEDYFQEMAIKDLDKSCCKESTQRVIDFDRVKEEYCKKKGLDILKSCDALKIIPEKEVLDFIEMKGFKEFINRGLNHSLDINTQVQKKAIKFDFVSKIRDSAAILYNIVCSQSSSITGKERKMYNEIPKKYIILTDIDMKESPLPFISLTLEFLAQTSSDNSIETTISKVLQREIENTDFSNSFNIQNPILLSCKDLEHFYRNY